MTCIEFVARLSAALLWGTITCFSYYALTLVQNLEVLRFSTKSTGIFRQLNSLGVNESV